MFGGKIGTPELAGLLIFVAFVGFPIWLTIRSVRLGMGALSISSWWLILLALVWCWLVATMHTHWVSPYAWPAFRCNEDDRLSQSDSLRATVIRLHPKRAPICTALSP
jgi:hypothetical protein